jgi:hypothetical protein
MNQLDRLALERKIAVHVVVAVMRSPEQAGAANMIPIPRKLGRHHG